MPGSVKMATAALEFTYKFSDTAKVTVKYISEACLPTGEVSMVGEQGEEVYRSQLGRRSHAAEHPHAGVHVRWLEWRPHMGPPI